MTDLVSLLLDAVGRLLGGVALMAAAHKMLEPRRTAAATQALTRWPTKVAAASWATALGIEASAGALLVVSFERRIAAMAIALLWTGYAAAVARAARSGRAVDCGCHFSARSTASTADALRPIMLAAAAAAVWAGPTAAPTALDSGLLLLAVPVLLILYVASDQIVSNRRNVRVAA